MFNYNVFDLNVFCHIYNFLTSLSLVVRKYTLSYILCHDSRLRCFLSLPYLEQETHGYCVSSSQFIVVSVIFTCCV